MSEIIAKTLAEIREELGDEVSLIYKDVSREPYIKSNHGYRGDIVTKTVDDVQLLQCHECGEYFENLSHHIAKHNIVAEDYKEKHGLAMKIPLVSKRISMVRREVALNSRLSTKGTWLKKGHSPVIAKRTYNPTSKANKYGTCSDAQIRARMQILRDIVNRSPKVLDALKYDSGLVVILRNKYGSWNNGKKRLGFKTCLQGNKKYTSEKLLAYLRKYAIDHCEEPMQFAFENEYRVSIQTYADHFGSWRKAKALAGLDQILAQIKEDTRPGSLKPIFKQEAA